MTWGFVISPEQADTIRRAVIERLQRLAPPAAAHAAKQAIAENAAEGLDAAGRPLVYYKPSYARWRARHGFQISRVDLRITGDLLERAVVTGGTLRPAPGYDAQKASELTIGAAPLAGPRHFYPTTEQEMGPALRRAIISAVEAACRE